MSARDVDPYWRLLDLLCLQLCYYRASADGDARERSGTVATKQNSARPLRMSAVNRSQYADKRADRMRDEIAIVISLSVSLGMVLLALVHGWLRLP